MILLDEMAVRFTTSGEAELLNAVSQINRGMLQLKTTMETASRTLVDQFGNVIRSSQAAAAAVNNNTGQMAAHSEAMGKKLEHFGVTAAFALAAMANGSESAVVKIAHGVAMLGFAFGPVAGAISTFVAVAGEQLIHWFNKAAEEAEKTKVAAEKTFAALVHGEDLMTTAKQANRLRTGDRFAEMGKDGEGGEPFGEAMRAGGVKTLASRLTVLQGMLTKANEAVQKAEGESVAKAQKRVTDLANQIIETEELLEPVMGELKRLDELANIQARADSDQSGPAFTLKKAEEAAKRRTEIVTIGFARQESAAQAHYAALSAIADKDTAAQLAALRARTAEELRISKAREAAIRASSTGTMTKSGIVGFDPDWQVKLAQENARRADLVQKGQADEHAIRAKGFEESKAQLIAAHAGAMGATKGNLEAQLALNASYFDILAELYPDDVAEWQKAQDEKTRILQEQTNARIRIAETAAGAQLASAHAAAQRQYAIMTQAANGDTTRQLAASKRLRDADIKLADEKIAAIIASGQRLVDKDEGWALKLEQARAAKSAAISAADDRDNAIMLAKASRVQQQSEQLAGMASGAFAALMEDGGGMKKFADFVMKQMGQMFIRIGEGWVAASGIFKAAAAAITAFSGGGALFAGLALIALGSALSSGGGGAFGGIGGGGGVHYSPGDSPRTRHDYATINPVGNTPRSMTDGVTITPTIRTPRPLAGHDYATIAPTSPAPRSMTDGVTMPGARESIVVNATIIGKDDPKAQREIGELIKRGRARGEIPG